MPRRIDTQAVIDAVRLEEQASDISTPASGYGAVYAKTDGKVYYIDDAGTINDLTAGGPGGDTTAIHDNESGEIAAITEKTSVVNADLILIEDSAATNAKKKVQIGTLLQSGAPTYFRVTEQSSDPSTPPSGYGYLYGKDDGGLYYIADDGIIKPGGIAEGCRVYHNADQSISSGVTTTLSFNSENFDTSSCHDTVTNNSRLIVQTGGKYLIFLAVGWAGNATGIRSIYITLNAAGTPIANVWDDAVTTGAPDPIRQECSTIYDLAAGDYVEAKVVQNSGGNLNVTNSGVFMPVFGMMRIG